MFNKLSSFNLQLSALILQFTECDEIDDHFETFHDTLNSSVPKLLDKATEYAQKWLKFLKTEEQNLSSVTLGESRLMDASASATNSSFWSSLIQEGIKYKSLIALLFFNMDRGQKFEATSHMRTYCLKSSSLYFALLGIPGSGAFKIFHPVLYNKALDTFKITQKLHLGKTL